MVKPLSSNPLNVSVEEAASALGIGRTLVFALIKNGTLRSFKLGKRRLIPVSELTGLIARLSQAA